MQLKALEAAIAAFQIPAGAWIFIVLALAFAWFYLPVIPAIAMAQMAGVRVPINQLAAMRMMKVPVRKVVYVYIRSQKAGLEVTLHDLQIHHLARGDIETTVDTMIAAKEENRPVTWDEAAAADLVMTYKNRRGG